MSKFSVTGQESGGSDLCIITPIQGEYLHTFGQTPNDMLTRHRAARDGHTADEMPRTVQAGNWFEDVIKKRYEIDFGVEIERMTEGFPSKHCNLVCSLDGQIDRRDKPMLITDWRGKTWELEGRINWETKFPIHPPRDPEALSYMLQCQGGMDNAETMHCILAYLPRSTMEWVIVVHEWNPDVCRAIGDAVDTFWEHMENDTYYHAQTTTEANKLIPGNRLPDAVDLRMGPNDLYTETELETLVQATTDYLTAKRTKKLAEQTIEDAQLVIQHFMGGVEKLKLDGADINWTTIENKPKPEKATITLGNLPIELEDTIRGCADKVTGKEPSKMTRRFYVKEIAHV